MAEEKPHLRVVIHTPTGETTKAEGYSTIAIVMNEATDGEGTTVYRFIYGDRDDLFEMVIDLIDYLDERIPGFAQNTLAALRKRSLEGVRFVQTG